ncbi:MAG: DUF1993 domain-containing protein [Proteobacteria bacterium]|nr:DUF1993 domain-containing protein [Pseudomonadota bacterium]
MYDISVPVMIHGLKSLSLILKKAEAHCTARKIKPEALLNFRLFPDMFPLTSQVQLASDFAKGVGARLSGSENPRYADEEKTFEELQARISKTVSFLESLDRGLFEAAASRVLKIRVARDTDVDMSGVEYFNRFALPNFYFHLATAYNILRHNGIELGKGDFMGRGV